MPSIGLKRLKQIIREEIETLSEDVDRDAGTKLMSSANKLLKAVEAFKSTSTEKVNSELGTSLDEVEKFLKRIVDSPMMYVDNTSVPVEKKVTLKPQKTNVV